MNARPIQNADLKVTKSDWCDSKGRLRCHISLKGASSINYVFWIHPDQMGGWRSPLKTCSYLKP